MLQLNLFSAAQEITLRGRTVTRADVLSAIAACEAVGKVRFLREHGFRDATRFALRFDGRSYPSKAVLGVAAGLGPRDFFGGAAHTARQLAALGFNVRNTETGAMVSRQLDSLRRAVEREGFDAVEPAWPDLPVEPTAYFASGSNRPQEIRGLSRAGADVGCAAPHVGAEAEAELHALAGSDVLVFVDSGAFSEVKFGPNGCEVVKPMSAAHWAKVLGLYTRLARSLGDQAWLVAPDRVGCQYTSLLRLELYRDEVRELHRLGARVLVPVQKGELTQAEFAAEVDRILGFDDWVPALPCKKAATTPEEVAEFVRERRPDHVHLLGLGLRAPKAGAYLAPFAGSGSSVSLDSCWIRLNVGKTNGRGGGPRRLTAARRFAEAVIERTRASVSVVELAVYSCLAGCGLVR